MVIWLLAAIIGSAAGNQMAKEISGVNDTVNLLREGYKSLQLVQGKDTIILLGNIGTGKSTLFKYIRGDPTLQVKESGLRSQFQNLSVEEQTTENLLVFTDGEIDIGGNGINERKTLVPNVDVDIETGTYLVDCVGLSDSRETKVQELATTYFNKYLLDNSQQIKLIIVENHANLRKNESGNALRKTLMFIADLVGENLDALEGSVGLIATKVEVSSKEDFTDALSETKDFISSILSNYGDEQDDEQDSRKLRKLIQFLTGNTQLFQTPQSQDLDFINEKNRNELRTFMFDQLNFSNPFLHELHATATKETEIFIRDNLISATEEAVRNEILTFELNFKKSFDVAIEVEMQPFRRMVTNAEELLSDFLDTLLYIDNLDEILSYANRKIKEDMRNLDEINFQLENARFFYEIVGKNFEEFKFNLMLSLKGSLRAYANAELNFASFLHSMIEDSSNYDFLLELEEVKQRMKRVIDSKTFKRFVSSLSDIEFSNTTVEKAEKLLEPTKKNIEWLNKLENEFSNKLLIEPKTSGNQLTITFFARNLILSDAKAIVENNKKNYGEFIVMAAEKLFIDCDLIIKHSHLKLLAPIVEVVNKDTVIRMIGGNGGSHQKAADSCKKKTRFVEERASPTKTSLGAPGENGQSGTSPGNLDILALEVKKGDWLTIMSEGGSGGNGQDGGNGCNTIEFTDLINHHDAECRNLHRNQPTCDIQSIPPTNGFKGGSGGKAALPGKLRVQTEKEVPSGIVEKTSSGNPGKGGHGGKAGASGKSCTCILNRNFPKYRSPRRKKNKNRLQNCCKTMVPSASNGLDGGLPDNSPVFNQNFTETSSLHDVVLEFRKSLLRQGLPLVETDAGRLLNFYFNSGRFTSNFTVQSFLNAIKIDIPLVGDNQEIQSQMFYFSTILRSVEQWKEINKSNALDDLEIKLLGLLDILQQFHHGKQVVRLPELVDSQLKRIEDLETAMEEVSKFEVIKSEKNAMLREIEDAQKMLEKVKQENIDELKEQSDREFSDLLKKLDSVKKQEYAKALENEKKWKRNYRKHIGLGVVRFMSKIAAVFFPPAALVTDIVTGVVDASIPEPEKHQDASNDLKWVNEYLERIQSQREYRENEAANSIKSVAELDTKEQFLSDRSRILVNKSFKSDFQNVNSDVKALLDSLNKNLDSKINKSSAIDAKRNNKRLISAKNILHGTSVALGAGVEMGELIQQCSKDKHELDKIHAVIKHNQGILKELDRFEQNMHKTFKPLIDEMMQFFNSTASQLPNQNSVMLLIQKLQLKKNARAFNSLLQQLGQEFFSKDEGFFAIVTDLQDLMTTLVDSYDKIEQMSNRVKLFDFIGKMSGNVNCHTTECISLKDLNVQIKLMQLTREFGFVYSAFYHQVSFPFGAQRSTKVLKATVEGLLSAEAQRVRIFLKSALELIQIELKAVETMTDIKDADVIKSDFFMSKTTRPFFIWRSAEHGTNIKKLLNGEQITLEASVHENGVRNAVKANWVALNITSEDEMVSKSLRELLDHFHLEMVRGKRSYFRCGVAVYAVSSEELKLTRSFETNNQGKPVAENAVSEKISGGNVPLSPYTLWKFRLKHESNEDPKLLFNKLGKLAHKVDLHLVGRGSYIIEGAQICNTALSKTYEYVGNV